MSGTLVIRSRADSPEVKKAALSIEQAAWNELGISTTLRLTMSITPTFSTHIQSTNSAS